MSYVIGFLPWILYWILVGNIDFRLTMVIVLAVAVGTQVVGRLRRQPWRSLEVGSLGVFVLLTLAAFVVSDAVLEQWLQPLSNLGLLLVAVGGMLVGRPFVREYAADTVDAATAKTDGFRYLTTGMTWLWVGAFAGMTVISAIPPMVEGPDSISDQGNPLSVLCYWVLPYTLLAMAGVVSGIFPRWFEKRSALVDQRAAAEAPTVRSPAAAPADLSTGALSLHVPAESSHDEPFAVVVDGVPAGATVELSASGADLFGGLWRASASFTADPSGSVDVATAQPRTGDWAAGDPAAPLWAMRFATPDRTPELFVAPVDTWPVTVSAAVAGVGESRQTVHRRTAAAGVRLQPVQSGGPDGLPAMLAWPAGPAPAEGWPAVACFGGSEGGFASQIGHAALFASHGYVALAASWVGAEDATKEIADVPLERFPTALRFLAGQDGVDPARISAMAVSRGAEGLLAALSEIPENPCRNLILVSPSSVTWQGIGADGGIPDTSSWTVRGRPVPWLPVPTGAVMPQLIRNAWRIGRDTAARRPTLLRLRPAYEAGRHEGAAHHPEARIAADRVDCPLLVLTGSDDAVWPSDPMAQELLARRNRSDDQHRHYDGAGHLIRLGNFPTDAQWTGGILLGGSREGQAAAQLDATARVLTFLSAPSPVVSRR